MAQMKRPLPFEGGWVEAVAGPQIGKRGIWARTNTYDVDGVTPLTIRMRTRDADNQTFTVNYADVQRPVDYYGGR